MKTILAFVLAVSLAPLAQAADSDQSAQNTVNTSKNPITGTVTTKHKWKRSTKHGKNQAKLDVTETTKTMKDGEVKKTVEVNGNSDQPATNGK